MGATKEKPQPRLNLSLLKGTYAVVRLDAGSKPPDWFWESNFYSLTKTEDELSIVCEQKAVPSDIVETDQCETGWGLFKVEGPLDFSLTGILNKLTNPLAKAAISVFAVSTYDTDYILVKEDRVFDSGYAWILAGHAVKGLPESGSPVDGHVPVVTFKKDIMIGRLLDIIENKPSAEETFGLVLNAGWVPCESTQKAYQDKLIPAIQKCFQELDYTQGSTSTKGGRPNVYLYPPEHLHVTVATLHSFTRPTPNQATREILKTEWGDLVRAASGYDKWPVKPLQLTVQSTQIGKSAGIILWNETTGGLDQMRICIQAELEARQHQLIRVGIDPDTIMIPNIAHSTFLRFHEIPETPGAEVQEKFQKYVREEISNFFPQPIAVPHAKLTISRIPYMHIKDDKHNVLDTYPFEAFEKDIMIGRLLDIIGNKPSVEETFGLVLNAGWVPSEATQEAYQDKLIPAVQKCFQESDYLHVYGSASTEEGRPNVYLYPPEHLHVTVATLHAFTRPTPDQATREILKKEWGDLVRAASGYDKWPVKPLQLTLQSAQIGKRAGILLWNETTGGLDQMRICIQAELKARQHQLTRAGIDPGTLKIPNIMHSTFLRFHDIPETPGAVVQENFQKFVKDEISNFFPHPIAAPHAKLVIERTPYMHIEDDSLHVLATFPFER